MPQKIPEKLSVLTGQYCPGWRVIEQIGSGSYSRVYRVQDKSGKQAALKWIEYPEDSQGIAELRARGASEEAVQEHRKHTLALLRQEIQLLEKLKGTPNIVTLYGHVVEQQEDGTIDLLMLMELLEPLSEAVPQMTVGDVYRLGQDICKALTVCERERIMHRDIKPDNIFRTQEGAYQLGDFGVARRVAGEQRHTKRGTPLYMAPEVYRGQATYDHRVDIYSLGLVMYELLNAQCPPFVEGQGKAVTTEEEEASMKARFAGNPLPPPVQAPEGLANVIARACSFDAEDRFETAEEMLQALQDADPGTQKTEKLQGMENRPAEQTAQASAAETRRALPRNTLALDNQESRAPRKDAELEENGPAGPENSGVMKETVVATDNPFTALKEKKARKRKKIIRIVIALVAVAALVVGGILVYNSMQPMKELGYTQQGTRCIVSWLNGGGGPWEVTAATKGDYGKTLYQTRAKQRDVSIRLVPGQEYTVTVAGNPLNVSMEQLPKYSGDITLESDVPVWYIKQPDNPDPEKHVENKAIRYSRHTGSDGEKTYEMKLAYRSASGKTQTAEALCLIQYGNTLEETTWTLTTKEGKTSQLYIPLTEALKRGNTDTGQLLISIYIENQLWYEGRFDTNRTD